MIATLAMFAKTVVVAVVVFVAIFYLRLGYFLVLVWPIGALLAIAASWRNIRASPSRVLAAAFVLLAFALVSIGLWKSAMDRKTLRDFDMTWMDRGDRSKSGEAEVMLEFERFPGHYVTIHSNGLRDHLKRVTARPIRATFEVTDDLGCMRGFHEVQVAGFTIGPGFHGTSGATGYPASSPWGRDPWWCT